MEDIEARYIYISTSEIVSYSSLEKNWVLPLNLKCFTVALKLKVW